MASRRKDDAAWLSRLFAAEPDDWYLLDLAPQGYRLLEVW